jgi:hypothetical protein
VIVSVVKRKDSVDGAKRRRMEIPHAWLWATLYHLVSKVERKKKLEWSMLA